MNYIYLTFAIIAETIGTTLLKNTMGFTVLMPTLCSLLAYGISFYLMSLCLQSLPTGVVYAVWSGIGIVLISFASFFVHKQALDMPAIVGIAMIVAGVVVIKSFSKMV